MSLDAGRSLGSDGGGKGREGGREVLSEAIPVWRREVAGGGGVDTHSYCSGHMLMRVTGL